MKFTLFACITATLITQGSGAVARKQAKLGETVELELGAGVKDVQAAIHGAKAGEEDRKDILKDGKITEYGQQRFGNRLSFENGVLIIKNLEAEDVVTYFFHLDGNAKKPMAIDIVLEP